MGAQSLSIQETGVKDGCVGGRGGGLLGGGSTWSLASDAGPWPEASLPSNSSGRGAMRKHPDTY